MVRGWWLAAVIIAIPSLAVAQTPLPDAIPIFPLEDVMLFPDMSVPLHIYEPRYKAMVADALKGNRIIGMVQLRPGYEKDYERSPSVFAVGCAGVISESEPCTAAGVSALPCSPCSASHGNR